MAALPHPISRRQHGWTDYSYIPAVLAAPGLAGFARDITPARLTRAFGGAIMLSSVLTRAEWGVWKVMPYKAHLALDAGVGLAALAAPWLFGFTSDRRARNTFVAMGVVGILAGLLSRPEEMPGAGREHRA